MRDSAKSYIEWVLQAQSSDGTDRNAAFDHLVRDFQGMVYGVAFTRLSDRQLAEDAAQEAFLCAYKGIAQLRDARAFPAWLKRIALSHAEGVLRRQGPPLDSIDEAVAVASVDGLPEAELEAAELRQRVRLAVAALPEGERDVTAEYYLMGESQRAISERRNLPLSTVKKRLQYAREHLRGLITGFNDSFDRAIYHEPRQKFQPVYIHRRNRRRLPSGD